MVGILVKWYFSWLALVALTLLGVWGSQWVDDLGKNYGTAEQQIVDGVTIFNYLLPVTAFFWFRHLLRDGDVRRSRIVLRGGWCVLLVAAAILPVLHRAPTSTVLLSLWRASMILVWLLPLGAWAIARGQDSEPRGSPGYSIGAAALAIASIVAVQLLGWEGAKAFGPAWGFAFVVQILLLCSAIAAKRPTLTLASATLVVAVIAYLMRFLIFFAGIFYGGGMLQPIVITVVVTVVLVVELMTTRPAGQPTTPR